MRSMEGPGTRIAIGISRTTAAVLAAGLVWMVAEGASQAQTNHNEVVRSAGVRLQYQAVLKGQQGAADMSLAEVGIRFWINERVGIDLGVGLLVDKPIEDKETSFGVALGVGLPIAMGNFKYFTPLLRPSFDVGIFRPGGSQLAEVIHIGLGLGGEIHFGFIGVPRLSLTGLLGLGIDVLHTDAGTGLTTKTEGGSSLWGLVESSLALTYYW